MPDPQVRDAIRAQYQDEVRTLSDQLSSGDLDLDQWHDGMKQALRDSYALNLRAGSDTPLKYTEYLKLGTPLKKQYGFLQGFIADIASGATTGGAIASRAEFYVDTSLSLYRPHYFQKDFTATSDSFAQTIGDAFTDAQAGDINRRNFAGIMRSTLRTEGLVAFRDGMNEVGYNPESLSAEEVQTFKDWLDRQSQLVTSLGDELFHGGGITQGEIANRVRMWVHTSLEEIHALGINAGNENQPMMWVYSEEAKHCPDCLTLDGQVHPMKAWISNNILPGSWSTQCKAGCKCSLVKTDKTESGNFLEDNGDEG